MKNKNTVFLICIILIFPIPAAYCQSFSWVNYQTHSIAINPDYANFPSSSDSQGNSFIASIYNYKVAWIQNMLGDFSLKKYNGSGQLVFNKIIYGKLVIEFLETDSQGNIYAGGTFMDTLKIDSVNFILNTGSGFNDNGFLFKLSPLGNFIWKKNINQSYASSGSLDAFNIKSDNLYLGILETSQNGKIKKLDTDGNELLNINELHIRGITSIDADSEGNILAAGSCSNGSITFGDRTFPSSNIYNVYFVKYNPSGNCRWAKFVEDITFSRTHAVCDNEGNLIACGDLFGSFAFGNLQSQGPQWVYDFFLTKLDTAGNFVWLKEVPNVVTLTGDARKGKLNCICVDSHNYIYFAGFLRGTVNWGNNVTTTGSSVSPDVLVLKYDKNGVIQWGKTAGGTSSDRADYLSIDNSNHVFLSGNFSNTAQFDSHTANGSGSINSFLAKLDLPPLAGIINLTMIVEGFYDVSGDKMRMTDTCRLFLRNSVSPYGKVDSSSAAVDADSFTGVFTFANASTAGYYLQLRHRNSIETWSSSPVNYQSGGSIAFNFSTSSSQAFGNNQSQVNFTPVRFGVYSGDVNQDGAVDLSDIVNVFNDAVNFVTGNVVTDLTGDGFVDLSDIVIAFNNSSNFISVIRP